MRKVMLVIDDFNELVSLETLLRRIGFDVLSLSKDVLVTDALLRFHPDLVIASYRGRAVDGTKLAPRMKKLNPAPIIALAYSGAAPSLSGDLEKYVEGMIEVPVKARSTIEIVAKLAKLPAEPMIARYEKVANVSLAKNDELVIVGDREGFERGEKIAVPDQNRGAGDASVATEWDPAKTPGLAASARSARSDRYEKFLHEHDETPPNEVLPHDRAAKAMAELKKAADTERTKLDAIDAEKRKFVTSMFKK